MSETRYVDLLLRAAKKRQCFQLRLKTGLTDTSGWTLGLPSFTVLPGFITPPPVVLVEKVVQEAERKLAEVAPVLPQAPDLLAEIGNFFWNLASSVWAVISQIFASAGKPALEELKEMPEELKAAAEEGLRKGLASAVPKLGTLINESLRAENPARSFAEGLTKIGEELYRSVLGASAETVRKKIAEDIPKAATAGMVEGVVALLFPGEEEAEREVYVTKSDLEGAFRLALFSQLRHIEHHFPELTKADITDIRKQVLDSFTSALGRVQGRITLRDVPHFLGQTQNSFLLAVEKLAGRRKLRLSHVLAADQKRYLDAMIIACGSAEAFDLFTDRVLADGRTFAEIEQAEDTLREVFQQVVAEWHRRR